MLVDVPGGFVVEGPIAIDLILGAHGLIGLEVMCLRRHSVDQHL